MFSFLLGQYLGVGWLGPLVTTFNVLRNHRTVLPNLFFINEVEASCLLVISRQSTCGNTSLAWFFIWRLAGSRPGTHVCCRLHAKRLPPAPDVLGQEHRGRVFPLPGPAPRPRQHPHSPHHKIFKPPRPPDSISKSTYFSWRCTPVCSREQVV